MEDSTFIWFLLSPLWIPQTTIKGLLPLLKITTNSLPMFSPTHMLNDLPNLTHLLHWILWTISSNFSTFFFFFLHSILSFYLSESSLLCMLPWLCFFYHPFKCRCSPGFHLKNLFFSHSGLTLRMITNRNAALTRAHMWTTPK